MPAEKISFPGSLGRLAARLDLPDSAPRAVALFAHCFTCSKEGRAATFIARALVEHGVALLRFDFTGLGGSEGDFGNTGFSSNVADLVAAAAWLRAEQRPPVILIGTRLWLGSTGRGGRFQCRAVVTLNAPFSRPCDAAVPRPACLIEGDGVAEVTLGGRTFRLRKEFLDDLAGQRPAQRIANLRRALLVAMRRPTPWSASTTPSRFSRPPSIRRASSRLMETIC
jgi:putative redox protein